MLKRLLQLIVVLLISAQGVVMAQTVKIDNVVCSPGTIRVQMDMLNFSGVSAITYYIDYDANLLEFVEIDSTTLTGSWLANYNTSINKLVITYTATPTGTAYAINGKLLDLVFNYKGGFSTPLTFDEANCEVTNGLSPVTGITYLNGNVDQSVAVGTVSLDLLNQPIGNSITMPLYMEGVDFDSISDFTYLIAYNSNELSYGGIIEDQVTGVTANASNGIITLLWTGGGSVYKDFTSKTHLLDIKFDYHGGDAAVEFQPGSEVKNGAPQKSLAVDYSNGLVTPSNANAKLTISEVPGVPGQNVDVPIVPSGFGNTTIGAMVLNFTYDASKLTYAGFTAQQLSGWVANSSTAGTVTLQCSSSTGDTLIEDNLVTLQFLYDTAGGMAEVSFAPGSEVTSVNFDTINVNYVDGYVDSTGAFHSVSGTLTYYGGTHPIATANTSVTTVLLKNQSDSTVAYSTTTDASGNYTFNSVHYGNYFLDATTTIDAKYSYTYADAFLIFGNGASLTGLPMLAANVDLINGITVADAYIVYGSVQNGNVKVSSWSAPDWIFENPSVVVSGNNLTINFSGICSGDANGDFIPTP